MSANRQSGLGRGLDSLIPWSAGSGGDSGVMTVDIDALAPNPMQPREHWDDEQLDDLARSISEHGIIQPVIASRSHGETPYTIIAGERRWRAAKLAGLSSLPVLVREATTREALELAIVENVQRSDLNPVEEAMAYRQLIDEFGFTQEAVATSVGKSRPAVANTLRLLDAPAEVQQAIVNGAISAGHGRAILAIETNERRIAALEQVIKRQLNVRQTEQLAKKSTSPPPTRRLPRRDPELTAIENQLRGYLGTKVTIKPSANGGRITIHYYSDEELSALLNRIGHAADDD